MHATGKSLLVRQHSTGASMHPQLASCTQRTRCLLVHELMRGHLLCRRELLSKLHHQSQTRRALSRLLLRLELLLLSP